MAHSLNRGPPRQAAAQSFPRSATVRLALERRAARGAPVETERAAPSWWTTVAQAAHLSREKRTSNPTTAGWSIWQHGRLQSTCPAKSDWTRGAVASTTNYVCIRAKGNKLGLRSALLRATTCAAAPAFAPTVAMALPDSPGGPGPWATGTDMGPFRVSSTGPSNVEDCCHVAFPRRSTEPGRNYPRTNNNHITYWPSCLDSRPQHNQPQQLPKACDTLAPARGEMLSIALLLGWQNLALDPAVHSPGSAQRGRQPTAWELPPLHQLCESKLQGPCDMASDHAADPLVVPEQEAAPLMHNSVDELELTSADQEEQFAKAMALLSGKDSSHHDLPDEDLSAWIKQSVKRSSDSRPSHV